MHRYKNPWHPYGPEFYETDAKPMIYRGYEVYQRIPGEGVDVVKDGVCVTQRAVKTLGQRGKDSIKKVIDGIIDGTDPFHPAK